MTERRPAWVPRPADTSPTSAAAAPMTLVTDCRVASRPSVVVNTKIHLCPAVLIRTHPLVAGGCVLDLLRVEPEPECLEDARSKGVDIPRLRRSSPCH